MQQSLNFPTDPGIAYIAPTRPVSHLREPQTRTLRYLAIGLLISLSLHISFLVLLPSRDVTDVSPASGPQGPMVVRLAPSAPAPPPSAAEMLPPQPTPQKPPRPPQAPQMMTVPSLTPQSTPLVPQPPEPIRPPVTPPTDFMSMVNAKRELRAAAEALARADGRASGREPSADEVAMSNINRNLRTLSQRDGTSGVFQILSKGHRAAQFSFNGWTGDRSNSRRDVIDVDAGLNGNIETAIIRRMIELIRTHYKGDFNWDSQRLGRVVVLSARVEDTAGLEEFMLREFFR